MIISRYDRERDYPIMKESWAGYGWPPPPPDALPRIGLVARTHQCNEFLAYMGLYAEGDGGNFGVIDWPVRNPNADPELADHALKGLYTQLERIAERKGLRYLYSITANDKWGKKLLKMGMRKSESGVTAYVKVINDNSDIDFMIDGGE